MRDTADMLERFISGVQEDDDSWEEHGSGDAGWNGGIVPWWEPEQQQPSRKAHNSERGGRNLEWHRNYPQAKGKGKLHQFFRTNPHPDKWWNDAGSGQKGHLIPKA